MQKLCETMYITDFYYSAKVNDLNDKKNLFEHPTSQLIAFLTTP